MAVGEEILRVTGLRKYFPVSAGFFGKSADVKAVDGVGFTIKRNSVFALVGESGCGKSTVARLVLRLMDATTGTVFFKGRNIMALRGKELKSYRRCVQIIFQDPFASLNPRMSIFHTLAEPFVIHRTVEPARYREKVSGLLDKVGMASDAMDRYPHEFSGGQRQRICIARALALSPELVVADEPLSSLDVSIQAQILNLLQELKEESGLSFLFISHDLNIVRYFSDEIAVMYRGRIVEQAVTEDIFASPLHPYTRILIDSAPALIKKGERGNKEEDEQTARPLPVGDIPSPANPAPVQPGCAFHPRCPYCFAPCTQAAPELASVEGKLVACHLYSLKHQHGK